MKEIELFRKFLLAGGIAALINWIARLILNDFFKLSLVYSIVTAHFIGMVVAFYLFKTHVFKSKKKLLSSSRSFFLVNIFSLIFVYFATLLLIKLFLFIFSDIIFIKGISYGLALGLTSITSFYLHKKFTY